MGSVRPVTAAGTLVARIERVISPTPQVPTVRPVIARGTQNVTIQRIESYKGS